MRTPSLRRRSITLALGVALAASLAATPAVVGTSMPADHSTVHALPFAAATVDPLVDLDARDPAGTDLVLVQFDDEGATAAVDATAATGAALVQPLAPVSYLVWANARQTRAIRALDGVRFAGVLPPSLRIAPSVDAATTLLRVTLVADDPELTARAATVVTRRFTATDGVVLTLPGDATAATVLSQRPEVYSVADGTDDDHLRDEKTTQMIVEDTSSPEPGYDPVTRLGADGSGVRVAVVDGGVDSRHPELSSRDITCTDYVAASAMCAAGNSDDAIGHGTFVSGVVLGDGSTGIGDGGPDAGFRFGKGVAPGADLHVQNAINLGAAFTRPPITELFADSVRSGAVVAQNSWGPSGTPQGYDEPTRQADAAVRDADPEAEGDQPIGVVFSIMNGSGGESTQGAPDEAKNIIAVGGTGSGRPGSPSGDDLCTCSAHGPNLDGRRLVDVVAPGQVVASVRAAQGTLCGIPPEEFPSPLHATCTGTSFASPHVSGAYAVFVEAYRAALGIDPSPALVKAALVNTATDLSRFGGVDADGRPLTPVPNDQQGWGRLDLGQTMDEWNAGTVVHRDQDVLLDATGASSELLLTVADVTRPLRATLTWTDAPGHGQGGELPAWVNDLDLELVSPSGAVYRGNVFADGWSVTGGTSDEMNNLENVWIEAPEAGTWTVRVRAASIIGDGVPSAGDLTDQDFALVVTNAQDG